MVTTKLVANNFDVRCAFKIRLTLWKLRVYASIQVTFSLNHIHYWFIEECSEGDLIFDSVEKMHGIALIRKCRNSDNF